MAPEALFNPGLIKEGDETLGIHDMTYASIQDCDVDIRMDLYSNIILSGGGSLIEGVAARMADEISDIGDVNVWCVEDPINAVATGALQLAGEMPDDMFTAIN